MILERQYRAVHRLTSTTTSCLEYIFPLSLTVTGPRVNTCTTSSKGGSVLIDFSPSFNVPTSFFPLARPSYEVLSPTEIPTLVRAVGVSEADSLPS